MRLNKLIKKYFESGNVCVTGLRGTGKDVLFGNVIARRKKSYVSNLDYTNGLNFHIFEYESLDINNTYKNFLSYGLNYYKFPYELGTDIYISDAGIYFPSQYNNLLNRDCSTFPVYMALSRQVSQNNVHINVQNLNRVWDKIREQSDLYITCLNCKVILGFCFLRIRLYDKMQSCIDRVKPCCIKVPFFAPHDVRMNYKMHIDKFEQNYGMVKTKFLIFKNKSKHDTYYFQKILESGTKKRKD